MPGFSSVGKFVQAQTDGAYGFTSFRKVPSQATTNGNWCDLSMASGNPVPNYYAASPLIAATLDTEKGIFHGVDVSPAKKFMKNLVLMTSTANAIPSTWYLLDYLLFYPFIDMDTVGEEQTLTNTVPLPRYATGQGVKMMMVNVAPAVGGGQFTVRYTNQDGISDRITPLHFCSNALNIATLTATDVSVGGFKPFLSLQSGDTGVQSIEGITFTSAHGGLCALVLVRPLKTITLRDLQGIREIESLRESADVPEIKPGAYLNLIGMTPTGSIGSGILTGYAEFTWG